MSGLEETNPPAALVADDNAGDSDDPAVSLDSQSETESLRSSILEHRTENGRGYHSYKHGRYLLPDDDPEIDRLDMQHHLFNLTFHDKLHLAPFKKPPGRALDIGCGTGIWTIDFADLYPESEVLGIDLSPIQPTWVPPNASFEVDDIEQEWNFSGKFDFIYSRFMTGSIRNWPRLFEQSFKYLNPGGTIELVDIVYPISCDDDTLKDTSLEKWSALIQEGFQKSGARLDSALEYKSQLQEAGYVDITEKSYAWPTNDWPKDPHLKTLGNWSHHNTMKALSALSLAVFTREGILGWSTEELDVLLAGVRRDLKSRSVHAYWKIYTVHAKKPE